MAIISPKIGKSSNDLTLDDIKKDIREGREFFAENIKRFNKFMYFTFVSTLSDDDKNKLQSVGKPPLTFNIVEAFLSNKLGAFAAQEPAVSVIGASGVDPMVLTNQYFFKMKILESYLRDLLTNPSNDQLCYQIYRDLMAGGFSVVKTYIDYVHAKTWKQDIFIEKCDPCLTFFDPMAQASHKGDGNYCGEVIPMEIDYFRDIFGAKKADSIKPSTDVEGFQWSWKGKENDFVLVADYYYKEQKEETLLLLSNQDEVLKKDYDTYIEKWKMYGGQGAVPIEVKKRQTLIDSICRYRVCESEILEKTETQYQNLPLVFFDGNSVRLQNTNTNEYRQITRPYIYNTEGVQKLKDFAGQTMAAEIENMMMSKLMAPVEGLPDETEYLSAYKNYQQASVIVYKAYKDDDPNIPLPKPETIPRTQTPSVVMDAFHGADQLTQMILGSYDVQPAMQTDVSGKAIMQGSLQSDQAAQPYMMGYIRGYNRVCENIVRMIPTIWTDKRSIPVRISDGKRGYVQINTDYEFGSTHMDYEPNDFQVIVEAGPSTSTQRQLAMQQLEGVMQALPSFARFMDEEGGEVMIDNMQLKGADRLKSLYAQWTQKTQQSREQQQQMMQQAQQIDMATKQAAMQKLQAEAQATIAKPQLEKMKLDNEEAQFVAKLINEDEQHMREFKVDAAKVAIAKQEADADMVKAMGALRVDNIDAQLKAEQIDAENARTNVDKLSTLVNTTIAIDKHLHTKALETDKHMHDKAMDIHGLMQEKEGRENGETND